jgi:hypothetical protein
MTFEQYLQNYVMQFDSRAEPDELTFSEIMEHSKDWHTQEMKSIRAKGANTTNSKYSKEERSEWAKKGGYPKGRKRKPVDNSNTTNK